jgi:phosphotransferase system HPr (HPr) family protein
MTDTSASIVTIRSELGMHASPATIFARLAATFESDVTVTRTDNGQAVDGSSLLAMLTLALDDGTEIEISARGSDATNAVAALVQLVESDFHSA